LLRYDRKYTSTKNNGEQRLGNSAFVLSFAVIAITKSVFENRFGDFANLIFSNKYNKVYRDSSHLRSSFTIAFFRQVIICFLHPDFAQLFRLCF
jgi:hypothetical protein